jgi:hypothetical protein
MTKITIDDPKLWTNRCTTATRRADRPSLTTRRPLCVHKSAACDSTTNAALTSGADVSPHINRTYHHHRSSLTTQFERS